MTFEYIKNRITLLQSIRIGIDNTAVPKELMIL